MINKIDHIGIAVRSIEESLKFYVDVLHLQLEGTEVIEAEQVKIAFLNVGETKFELLEAISSTSPIHRFIEKKGEGIHHVALGVSSIEERIRAIKDNGLTMINDKPKPGAGGAKIAFMHPLSTGGVLFELCEKNRRSV